jgi:hypothetical protein
MPSGRPAGTTAAASAGDAAVRRGMVADGFFPDAVRARPRIFRPSSEPAGEPHGFHGSCDHHGAGKRRRRRSDSTLLRSERRRRRRGRRRRPGRDPRRTRGACRRTLEERLGGHAGSGGSLWCSAPPPAAPTRHETHLAPVRPEAARPGNSRSRPRTCQVGTHHRGTSKAFQRLAGFDGLPFTPCRDREPRPGLARCRRYHDPALWPALGPKPPSESVSTEIRLFAPYVRKRAYNLSLNLILEKLLAVS